MNDDGRKRYVISVLLPDRVAILRDISIAVTDIGGNIDGISQTVVAGYFNVIITATMPGGISPEDVNGAIRSNFDDAHLSVVVEPYKAGSDCRVPSKGDRYIATAYGQDGAGILKTITSFLASKDVNIEDWSVEFIGDQVTHVGEVTVSKLLDIKQVQDEYRERLAAIGLKGGIQHENIFRATNEVGAIRPLLSEGGS